MHAARLVSWGEHRTYEAPLEDLSDGTFVQHDDRFWLVLGASVLSWSFDGYGAAQPRTALPTTVTVRTPELTVAVLRAGFVPMVHPSADAP